MDKFKAYYKQPLAKRREILDQDLQENLNYNPILKEKLYDEMIENAISKYEIPMGLVPNFLMNDQFFHLPIVTEEPSVIAAANHAAHILRKNGGIQAQVLSRTMRGQIAIKDIDQETKNYLLYQQNDLLEKSKKYHPSIVKRGGGVLGFKTREIQNFFILDVFVDTKEAMGANIINTILEGISQELQDSFNPNITMSVLSNLSTEALVKAECLIDLKSLKPLDKLLEKMIDASDLAQIDPYRAATHNKGIMNGIDGLVIASGNDWRAVEAAAHSYAARNNSYQGLSRWQEKKGKLHGQIELPVPVGTVGGSISLHPAAQLSQRILKNVDAKTLMMLIASLGLAQNFAALYALTTDGIQKGHMKLHARSIAINAGATSQELDQVVEKLVKSQHINLNTAKKIITEQRKTS